MSLVTASYSSRAVTPRVTSPTTRFLLEHGAMCVNVCVRVGGGALWVWVWVWVHLKT